jgi:hypothetical protein
MRCKWESKVSRAQSLSGVTGGLYNKGRNFLRKGEILYWWSRRSEVSEHTNVLRMHRHKHIYIHLDPVLSNNLVLH